MPNRPFDESAVRAALAEFKDPETGRPITKLEQVHDLRLEGDRLSVVLGLTTWAAPLWTQTQTELAEHLRRRLPGLSVSVEVVAHVRRPEKLGEIGLSAKTVLAVGSGKGGVGKSSVAAYLAAGLRRAGCEVGLMDADVYGPSIPHLFGLHQRPRMIDDRIEPVVVEGMKLMSIGLLVPPDEAVIWRGPMLHNALAQFLRDTLWGDLDYLVIDMPPGTGDVAISLSQLLPLAGAVVVCTPQDVALLDAGKAVAMFRKVLIEVVGMVENMSYFVCPNCHARHEIFGSGGARRRAAEWNVPFLGEIPIHTELRAMADEGRVAAAFDDPLLRPCLESLCRKLVESLAETHRHRPALPPLPMLG
jgi:ATP-binding protein involved in chromosome partitioning